MQSSSVSAKHRPLGIVLLAILNLIASLIFLCIVLSAMSSLPAPSQPEAAGRLANQWFLLWGQAISGFIAAVGLWFLAEWARWLTIVRAAVAILTLLGMSASETVTGSTLLQVLISVAVIVYLLQPGVRKAFEA